MTLPNLIMNEPIIPEFLQEEATETNIAEKASSLLEPSMQDQMRQNFKKVCKKLGEKGVCSRAAQEILLELQK